MKKDRKGMHFGRIETSPLLQKTLEVLQGGGEYTTRQIRLVTRSQAVHSDISALRKNDYVISCRYLGKFRGRKRYAYSLEGKKGE